MSPARIRTLAVTIVTAACLAAVHLLGPVLLAAPVAAGVAVHLAATALVAVLTAVLLAAPVLAAHLLIVLVLTVGTVLLALAWAVSQAATETGWRVVPRIIPAATA